MRRLCSTVLIMEMMVIILAVPVATAIGHTRSGPAWIAGGVLAVLALLLAGVVGRPKFGWALPAGGAFQVAVIAAGIVVPVMYVLGLIFAAFWFGAIRLARYHQVP